MPQRFLRPQITNSERWNSVSWQSQSLYIRIITLVDDYGRYDGRAPVIWSNCFAVWNDRNPENQVQLPQCEGMLQELAAKLLIDIYEVDRKRVLQITQWCERVRAGVKEKWPANIAASCSKLLPSSPSPSSSTTPAYSPSASPRAAFNEIPTFEDAFKQTATTAIPKDFCQYVYDDWNSRQGKDAGGTIVAWLPYVNKRWNRERVEWQAGTHKGKKRLQQSGAISRPQTELEILKAAI